MIQQQIAILASDSSAIANAGNISMEIASNRLKREGSGIILSGLCCRALNNGLPSTARSALLHQNTSLGQFESDLSLIPKCVFRIRIL
jgi:hypothetical protein